MKKWMKILICTVLSFMFLFFSIGYAELSELLLVNGTADVSATQYDIYITDITPQSSGNVTINDYYYTIVDASVSGQTTATFDVTVRNVSDKIYVFERIVEGSESGFPGIYGGEGVSYSLNGLKYLQEVAPSTELTFSVTINVEKGVQTDDLLTFFKFIEKTNSDILPDGTDPDPEPDPDPDPDPDTPVIDTENNYKGLLDYLLSENDRCLNDPGDNKQVIYSAVREALKKSPYLLHCLTNAIPGGNMTNITTGANEELSVKMHFLIMADRDDSNVMYVYMYHMDTATSDNSGERVLTYFAVVRRDSSNSDWYEDGVYEGLATVAYLGGGGSNNKKEWMIDPSTWTAGVTN